MTKKCEFSECAKFYRIGSALAAILVHFSWRNIAIFSNDDSTFQKCLYAKEGLVDEMSDSEIGVSTSFEVNFLDDIPESEFAKFWQLAITDTRSEFKL